MGAAMIRSTLFNLSFYLWTTLMVLAFTPGLLMPYQVIVWGQRQWALGVNWLLAKIVNIKIEIRGQSRLPQKAPYIVAAKHQSAWDTIIWHAIIKDPAIILKEELLFIPIYGLMCKKSRMIPVNRKGGAKSLKAMAKKAKDAIEAERPIIIFPQGTRTAFGAGGDDLPYQPGTSALYRTLGVPVVPVSLNSGYFWPRRAFVRKPGKIILEYLTPIEPGMKRIDFEAQLKIQIESATKTIEAETLQNIQS